MPGIKAYKELNRKRKPPSGVQAWIPDFANISGSGDLPRYTTTITSTLGVSKTRIDG